MKYIYRSGITDDSSKNLILYFVVNEDEKMHYYDKMIILDNNQKKLDKLEVVYYNKPTVIAKYEEKYKTEDDVDFYISNYNFSRERIIRNLFKEQEKRYY
jgi:hypothetical protein